jgi:hypothetical protein
MSDQRKNLVDLYQPIVNSRVGLPPISLRAIVTPSSDYVQGGVPINSQRAETYVLLSALPAELQERVKTAIQALISGR